MLTLVLVVVRLLPLAVVLTLYIAILTHKEMKLGCVQEMMILVCDKSIKVMQRGRSTDE